MSVSEVFSLIAEKVGFQFGGTQGENDFGRPKNQSWSAAQISIGYDAATDSFKLTAPDLTQTLKLGQSTATADGGTALLNFYQGAGGTTYVRMVEWSNITPAAPNTDYRYSLFSFGMPTPNSALVRTGTAGYAVDVRGIASDYDNANAMRFTGNGTIYVDLAGSRLRAAIPLFFTEAYTGGRRPIASDRGDLTFDARIASAASDFSGWAHVWGGIGSYYGAIRGSFFGPSAQEIGGHFTAANLDGNIWSQLAGSFAGSKQATAVDPDGQIKRLADLPGPTALGFERIVANETQFSDLPRGVERIEYDPVTATYRVSFPEMRQYVSSSGGTDVYLVSQAGTPVFSSATKDAVQPFTGFDAHTATVGLQRYHAYLLRPDNPYVQLSYVSLAGFAVETQYSGTPSIPHPSTWYRSFTYFGNRSISVPTAGTASYTGAVFAWGFVSQKGVGGGSYDVTGRARMSVDFGNQTFNATLDQLVGIAHQSGPVSDPAFATYNFPSFGESGILANGKDIAGQTSTGYDRFRGSFFGPNAAEFGILFERRSGVNGVDPLAWQLAGVAVGKKD